MFFLKQRIVTSPFGIRDGKKHNGTDYRANFVPIDAPFDGRMIRTGVGDESGLYVVFKPDHDDVEIKFFHLSENQAIVRHIQQGERIAVSGNSGKSTGPHVHNEVWRDGKPTDPELYMWDDFKVLILNLDVEDQRIASFPQVLSAKISELSGGKFPVKVEYKKYPVTDALAHVQGTDAKGVDFAYLRQIIDAAMIDGYHTVFVAYHFPKSLESKPEYYNLRPMASGDPHRTMFITQGWFWQTDDIGEDPTPSWIWAVVHELSHSIFFRLNALGVGIADTTHMGNMGEFRDEYALFAQYRARLLGSLVDDMKFSLWRTESGKDVYLVRSGQKTLVYNAGALSMIADFSDIKIVSQAELDAVPDTGKTIALITNE